MVAILAGAVTVGVAVGGTVAGGGVDIGLGLAPNAEVVFKERRHGASGSGSAAAALSHAGDGWPEDSVDAEVVGEE